MVFFFHYKALHLTLDWNRVKCGLLPLRESCGWNFEDCQSVTAAYVNRLLRNRPRRNQWASSALPLNSSEILHYKNVSEGQQRSMAQGLWMVQGFRMNTSFRPAQNKMHLLKLFFLCGENNFQKLSPSLCLTLCLFSIQLSEKRCSFHWRPQSFRSHTLCLLVGRKKHGNGTDSSSMGEQRLCRVWREVAGF